MTLYRKLLENRIDYQQSTEGVIAFGNKWHFASTKIKNFEYIRPVSTSFNTSPPNYIQSDSQALSPNVKVTNEAIISCENTPLKLDALEDDVIAKIPVVLAELVIRLNVDSLIDLHEPIYRLHKVKKHLHITKSLLIQNSNILFIKGFVRNNIEYYICSPKPSSSLRNELRDCLVDIPFKCTTSVLFNGTMPATIIPNSVQEFEYGQHLTIETPNHHDSDDYWQLNQISTAFYNERPFCEIASSKIVELDEIHNSHLTSTIIEVNLMLYLTLKILQYRQVAVSSTSKK